MENSREACTFHYFDQLFIWRPASMPINIDKPRNKPMQAIRITEFKDHIINPDPIILQETDVLLEEFLSPTKLVRFEVLRIMKIDFKPGLCPNIWFKKALTGVDDLYEVESLEMIVDTSETSLGNFGIYLPNLKQLKLSNSFVPRIRYVTDHLTPSNKSNRVRFKGLGHVPRTFECSVAIPIWSLWFGWHRSFEQPAGTLPGL